MSPKAEEQTKVPSNSSESSATSPSKGTVGSGKDVGLFTRGMAALFYALASIMIMVVNKQVLTGFRFPSFQVLGMGQMISTIVVLQVAKMLGYITLPKFSVHTLLSIWPLPVFYVGNMLFGLGGTKALSLPMLTVLRRFSILMTMIGEYLILKVKAPLNIQVAVFSMIFGAIIAAVNDLAFNLQGYVFVLLNDVCTAGTGVVTKKKLNANNIGKYGLMYYNALLMLPPTALVSYQTGDLQEALEFSGWSESPTFCFLFFLSCIFGFILMYSTLVCTQFNSALTTSMIGSLKNIFITYLGMIFGGDYIFSWWNFIGLSFSAVASIMYTKITFTNKSKPKEVTPVSRSKMVSQV